MTIVAWPGRRALGGLDGSATPSPGNADVRRTDSSESVLSIHQVNHAEGRAGISVSTTRAKSVPDSSEGRIEIEHLVIGVLTRDGGPHLRPTTV